MTCYADTVATLSNDVSKEKYAGVQWAKNAEERCPEYVSRLKVEFMDRPHDGYWDGGQYEEVRCRRKNGHKGACLNNKPYPSA